MIHKKDQGQHFFSQKTLKIAISIAFIQGDKKNTFLESNRTIGSCTLFL